MSHPEAIRRRRCAILLSLAWAGSVLVGGEPVLGAAPPIEEQILQPSPFHQEFGHSVGVSGDVVVVGAARDPRFAQDDDPGAAFVYRYDGTSWVQELALAGAGADQLGYSVAASGDLVVVGAPGDEALSTGTASVFVYRYDGTGWVLETEKVSKSSDLYGSGVGVSGDVMVVSAPWDDFPQGCGIGSCTGVNAGSVRFYRFNGTSWIEEQEIFPAPFDNLAGFGSVAVSGDVAVIGVWASDDFAGSAYIYRYDGTSWIQEAELHASDASADDRFGGPVAISGDLVIVGANGNDDLGNASGSAYIFRYDGATWIEEAKLLASDGAEGDVFGLAVALSGDAAIVGASRDEDLGFQSGSAYVFRYDGTAWNQEAKVLASDATAYDLFGSSVALSGGRFVIGRKGHDRATVFRLPRPGEELQHVPGGAAGDLFGSATSLSGDVALVGAPGDDNQRGDSAGSAYLYRYDGTSWAEEATLTDYLGAAGDQFGKAVAVSGDVAAVGFPFVGEDAGGVEIFRYDGTGWPLEADKCCGVAGSQRGASVGVSGDVMVVGEPGATGAVGRARIYRYDGSTWGTGVQISASDAAIGDHFGTGVAVSGDVVVAGAPQSDSPTSNAGAAYVYRYAGFGWVEEQKLADGATDDQFGLSVAVSGDVIVVGAPYDDNAYGTNAGSARVYRYDGGSWVSEGTLESGEAGSFRNFGYRVAIWGDAIAVGAPNMPGGGAVYAFRYGDASTGWVLDRKLTVGDGVSGDALGSAVAVWGDMALAGAPGDDDLGSNSGTAHLIYLPEPHPLLALAVGIFGLALLRGQAAPKSPLPDSHS